MSSIPSTPDRRAGGKQPHGVGSYVFGGAALFAVIVAISFLAAPYIRVPPKSPAEVPAVEAPGAAPALVVAPPLATPATGPGAPAQERITEIVNLRRDLEAKEATLLEVQRSMDKERQARKAAQIEVDRLKKDSSINLSRRDLDAAKKAAAASHSERDAAKRDLEVARKELERLTTSLASAKRDAERDEAVAARIVDLETKLAESERRAKSRTSTLENQADRHQQAMREESEAVKTMLADLTRTRDELETERAARRGLERKLAERTSATSDSAPVGASRPPSAPVAPPPTNVPSTVPERVKTVPPQYPDDLRIARISGRVLLRVLVDEMGNVADVQIASSPHPRLALVAEQAARYWKYTPARQNGLRTKTWLTEAVDFAP